MSALDKSRRQHLSAALAVAGALALVGSVAAPAHAAPPTSVYQGGCTVTLEKVRYHHTDSSGYKRVAYPVQVKCLVTRDVVVHQERWEEDNKWSDQTDDKQGESNLKARVKAGTTVRWEQVYRMPDTPHDGNEELYHKAWFTVRTVETYPVTSPKSVWLQTPYTSIPN